MTKNDRYARSLDPDRYQMKDIKRRVASLERHLLRVLRRVEDLEAWRILTLDLPPESVEEE